MGVNYYGARNRTVVKTLRFGKREVKDIAIALFVMSVSFMILYRHGQIMDYLDYHMDSLKWIGLFGLCVALVFCSFILHEFGHKFSAQYYGMESEFQLFPMGMLLTLATSFLGFLFAAPGAVVIYGRPTKKMKGVISAAGPIVNIVLAAVGIWGCLQFNYSVYVLVFLMLATLNGFLALFNMLPIPPMDGSNIIRWSYVVYAGMIIIAALEVMYVFMWMPDLYFKY